MEENFTEKRKTMIRDRIRNPRFTNCYLSCQEVMDKIALHDIHCFCYEGIVILIHPLEDGIHKMYYFLEDCDLLTPDLVAKIRKDLENYQNLEGTVVARMPDKNVDVLERLGFHLYKEYIRKQMIPATGEWSEPEHVIETADIEDLNAIYELMHKTFDILTDHLVSRGELRDLLKMSQVLKISIQGVLAGFLLFEVFGKKSYLRSICVSEDFAGKKVGLSLLRGYFLRNRENTRLFYLWVENTNEKAIRLYERLGYKDDGLIEYTYLY